MTMVRNITSHSERAVAIESGEFSNALSGKASRAAFLVRILGEGTKQSEVPKLMSNARGFIDQVSVLADRFGSQATQSYRNLIQVAIVVEPFDGNIDQVRKVANDLRSALDSAESHYRDVDMSDLADRLDEVSDRLAHHAHQVGRSTVGV